MKEGSPQKHFIRLFLLLLLFSFSTANAQPNPPSDTNTLACIDYPPLTPKEGVGLQLLVPPAIHPRLYLTPRDLPLLQQKMVLSALPTCVEKLQKDAAFTTDGWLRRYFTVGAGSYTLLKNR